MLELNVDIGEFTRAVVSAAKHSDYAAFIFVLAREADAGWLYDDLAGHWSSLHDVTGDLVAIISPSTDSDGRGWLTGGKYGRVIANPALQLHLPGDAKETFMTPFWARFSETDPATSRASPLPRLEDGEERRRRDGWSTAVRATATVLGLSEQDLPCLVVLSVWEQCAVIIPATRRFSVYKLTKELAESLETSRTALMATRSDLQRLDDQFLDALAKFRARADSEKRCDKWRERVREMKAAIPQALGRGDSRYEDGERALQSLLDGEVPTVETFAILEELHRALQPGVQHARHSDVFGLIEYLREHGPILHDQKPTPNRAQYLLARDVVLRRASTIRLQADIAARTEMVATAELGDRVTATRRTLTHLNWPATRLSIGKPGAKRSYGYT